MLQRTLEKQNRVGQRVSASRIARFAVPIALVVAGYLALPEPGPRIRSLDVSDSELRARLASLLPEKAAAPSTSESQVELGRALFHSPLLSGSGSQSCAGCHVPQNQFGGERPLASDLGVSHRLAPSLVNSGRHWWFGWDGRADSIAAMVLDHFEDPKIFASSRLHVVRSIVANFAAPYERAYGPLPAVLVGSLPRDGRPADQSVPSTRALGLPQDSAAYALATLGSFPLLTDILSSAQAARRAPAVELARRAIVETAVDEGWTAAWNGLPEPTQSAVNEVFVRVARAIEAYVKGLESTNAAPFDQFARRALSLAADQELTAALAHNFGSAELTGLKLFLGPARCVQCHNGPTLTDQQFHNIGLSQLDLEPTAAHETLRVAARQPVDLGRVAGLVPLAKSPWNCSATIMQTSPSMLEAESCRELPYLEDAAFVRIGAFKTPGLRNVAQRTAYMHDGRFRSLDEVLTHYDELTAKPATGHRDPLLQALALTPEERHALLAFLNSLSAPVREAGSGRELSQSQDALQRQRR